MTMTKTHFHDLNAVNPYCINPNNQSVCVRIGIEDTSGYACVDTIDIPSDVDFVVRMCNQALLKFSQEIVLRSDENWDTGVITFQLIEKNNKT